MLNEVTLESATDIIQRFWDIESYGTVPKDDVSAMTVEDKRSVEILKQTTFKSGNHYITGLLWKESNSILPNNKSLALSRLYNLERKLAKHPQIRQMYTETMKEYIKKGYARKLSDKKANTVSPRTNYIPHHSVTNINKPNKLRIVFDAAAKFSNTSLNQHLLKGPDLLNSLVGILLRFREGQYAIIGDIEAMYHQVKVLKEDTDSLRFLWRENFNASIDEYIMCVHIFGKVDSPCCANWALKRTAIDNKPKFSLRAIEAVLEHFYMDDYLDSFPDLEAAIKVIVEVIQLLKLGGFNLTKFVSNNSEIDKYTRQQSSTAKDLVNLDLDETPIERALGVLWDPKQDVLKIKTVNKEVPNTKRGILSFVSSIFDPLGILSPSLIEPNQIIQDLWKQNVDWDEQIPADILQRWQKWKGTLKKLESVKISRWYHTSPNDTIELHIFSDASSIAYGAVSYLRISRPDVIYCNFILGKSRLAPVRNKTMTIPRLELQAAVLASRLKTTILSELKLKVNQVFLWSDSSTVLKYIKNEKVNFGQYIMHRSNEIRNNSNPQDWRYVPSDLNVADDCSRGVKFNDLSNNHRWITGPSFLYQQTIEFEQDLITCFGSNEIIDAPINVNLHYPLEDTSLSERQSNYTQIVTLPFNWEYYSSWDKLTRHVALIIKIKRNWLASKRSTQKQNFKFVSVSELHESGLNILRFCQSEPFCKRNPVPKNSTILSLEPAFTDNLLRVGGRLKSTELSLKCHSQIIIDKNHPLAALLIKYHHEINLHSGREQTLSSIRKKYWITSCRGLIRVLKNCSSCKRRSAKPQQPFMSNIPIDRIAVNEKPFSNTGVDYFGPIIIKLNKRTRSTQPTAKRYGVLFTCLTTRGVHLELATDITTDAFILALRRFIARRGHVKILRSDNGSNFIGAEKELKHALTCIDQNKVAQTLSKQHIQWKFNLPVSPWMGGVWEALVKTVKRALRTITRERLFTEDALTTFLCEVESIVN